MGGTVPLIEPVYPKAGNGRWSVREADAADLFLQQWFNLSELSDPAAEEALRDSAVIRDFAGMDLGNEPVPDETTVCKFRDLRERNDRKARIFERVNGHLQRKGTRVSRGTIVYATILSAPSSTKKAPGVAPRGQQGCSPPSAAETCRYGDVRNDRVNAGRS